MSTATEARYPFANLERALGGGTLAEMAHRLGLPLTAVRRMKSDGLTEDEASDVCADAALDVSTVWPDRPVPQPEFLPPGFEWVDEPPGGARIGGRDELAVLCRPLTENPGRWAKVKHYQAKSGATSAAKSIREGRKRMPPGRYEALSRAGADGGSDLYVRYLGPAEP